MQVFECDGHIEIVPVRPIAELRGRFKGIDTRLDEEGMGGPNSCKNRGDDA